MRSYSTMLDHLTATRRNRTASISYRGASPIAPLVDPAGIVSAAVVAPARGPEALASPLPWPAWTLFVIHDLPASASGINDSGHFAASISNQRLTVALVGILPGAAGRVGVVVGVDVGVVAELLLDLVYEAAHIDCEGLASDR